MVIIIDAEPTNIYWLFLLVNVLGAFFNIHIYFKTRILAHFTNQICPLE